MSDAVAYIISTILSDSKIRESSFWNSELSLEGGRQAAAKTGTSNVEAGTGSDGKKKILPRDLWTAGYTPQITTVVWAGNISGAATTGSADGLNVAAPIWRMFMNFAHKNLPLKTFTPPSDLITATISNISGKLVGTSTPSQFRVSSVFAVQPTQYENSLQSVTVDSLCNGAVTDLTPPAAIKTGYYINASPVIDSYDPSWLSSVQGYINNQTLSAYGSGNIILSYSSKPCDRTNIGNISLTSNLVDGSTRQMGNNYVEVKFQSKNPVTHIQFLKDGEVFLDAPLAGNFTSGVFATGSLDFDESFSGTHQITIRAFDNAFYTGEASYQITVSPAGSGNPPLITFTNPAKENPILSIYQNQYANIRFTVTDDAQVQAVNWYASGSLAQILGNGNSFTVPVNQNADMQPGTYTFTVEAIDSRGLKSRKDVTVVVLPK